MRPIVGIEVLCVVRADTSSVVRVSEKTDKPDESASQSKMCQFPRYGAIEIRMVCNARGRRMRVRRTEGETSIPSRVRSVTLEVPCCCNLSSTAGSHLLSGATSIAVMTCRRCNAGRRNRRNRVCASRCTPWYIAGPQETEPMTSESRLRIPIGIPPVNLSRAASSREFMCRSSL